MILALKKLKKRGKSFNTGQTFYLFFLRFYRCFFKTVRQSVYQNRISGRATSRCIVHGRCEIEDWAHTARIDHVVAVHVASDIHNEQSIGIVRITGNCPFIKPHIHPIDTCGYSIIRCCISALTN